MAWARAPTAYPGASVPVRASARPEDSEMLLRSGSWPWPKATAPPAAARIATAPTTVGAAGSSRAGAGVRRRAALRLPPAARAPEVWEAVPRVVRAGVGSTAALWGPRRSARWLPILPFARYDAGAQRRGCDLSGPTHDRPNSNGMVSVREIG